MSNLTNTQNQLNTDASQQIDTMAELANAFGELVKTHLESATKDDESYSKKEDAVGALGTKLLAYCDSEGIDLETAIFLARQGHDEDEDEETAT